MEVGSAWVAEGFAASHPACCHRSRRGADIEALDTYGMTPLHRCASNNLAAGAEALLAAGADPAHRGSVRLTPLEVRL